MSFFKGCRYLADGFGLLLKPGIKQFAIIPVIFNIILFAALFGVLYHYISQFSQWFMQWVPAWLAWLSVIIWLLFVVSFILMVVYLFVAVANIITAPFNSVLASKTENYLTGHPVPSQSEPFQLKDISRAIGRQISLFGYYLPRMLGILLLFVFPVVQSIASVLWFVFSAWMLTLTYLDYPTDNHHVAVAIVRGWMHQNRGLVMGFGVSVLIVSMIPILNFFVVPAAVAGATKLWVKERLQPVLEA